MSTLLAALCLVLVIEGLVLLVAPGGWKRMAEQAQRLADAQLRRIGLVVVVLGLVGLQLVR